MPIVSVFLAPGSSADAARAIQSLRAQTLDDWEGIVLAADEVGAQVEPSAGRVRIVHATSSWQAALNNELEGARGEYILILPAGCTLRPDALRDMVAEASAGRADAVYARFRFASSIGELPVDPLAELPGILGVRQWELSKAVPLAAQMFRREVIVGEPFDSSLGDAADWEWCLRLARKGIRWRRCETIAADVELRPIAAAGEVLDSIRRHVGVLSPVTVGGPPDEVAEPKTMLVEAKRRVQQLIEFQQAKNAWMSAGMAMPWRFAQWWYRLGFVGPAPEHLLTERSPAAAERLVEMCQKPPVDIFVASYKRPDRLPAMIESVRATGYPARVFVAAGDLDTVRACERFPEFVECVYSSAANRHTGCTAPLNHVVASLVRNDAIFCTDDCVFARDSIETAVRSLYAAYPDSDGVVGLAQENIPGGYELAFPLIGKRFRERLTQRGELFFPGYFHMYNDAELGITIKCLGRWHFEARARLSHFHPCTGVAEDATHTRGRTFGERDARLWHERRMKGLVWGIDE